MSDTEASAADTYSILHLEWDKELDGVYAESIITCVSGAHRARDTAEKIAAVFVAYDRKAARLHDYVAVPDLRTAPVVVDAFKQQWEVPETLPRGYCVESVREVADLAIEMAQLEVDTDEMRPSIKKLTREQKREMSAEAQEEWARKRKHDFKAQVQRAKEEQKKRDRAFRDLTRYLTELGKHVPPEFKVGLKPGDAITQTRIYHPGTA